MNISVLLVVLAIFLVGGGVGWIMAWQGAPVNAGEGPMIEKTPFAMVFIGFGTLGFLFVLEGKSLRWRVAGCVLIVVMAMWLEALF